MKSNKISFLRDVEVFNDKRHVFITGITGSGKTALTENVMTSLWQSNKWKVIGVTLKSEMCTLGFPERDKKLVSIMKYDFNTLPRAYPQEVFIPFVKNPYDLSEKEMSLKLPKHSEEFISYQKELKEKKLDYGWCEFKPFKISIEQLSSSDWVGLLQNVTEAGKTILPLLFQSKDFKSIEDLLKELIQLSVSKKSIVGSDLLVGAYGEDFATSVGKPETYVSLVTLVSRLQKTGLIVDSRNPFVLDLDKIMMDTETITIFDLNSVSKPIAHMIFTAIFSKLIELRNRKDYPHALIVIPEVHNFAPAKASISPFAVNEYSSLGITQHLSKEVRLLGTTLLCDSQSPTDVDLTVYRNFGWWAIGYCHRDLVKKIHQNIVSIPEPAIYNIPNLSTGQFCVIPIGFSEYQYPCIFCPPRGYHRKAGESVFDWILQQPFIEEVSYHDVLKRALFLAISKRGVVEASKLELERATFEGEKKDFNRIVKEEVNYQLKFLKEKEKRKTKFKKRLEEDLQKEVGKTERDLIEEEKWKMVRKRYENGVSVVTLARLAGCTRQYIYKRANQEKWSRL